jgi:hypothetical protein
MGGIKIVYTRLLFVEAPVLKCNEISFSTSVGVTF